MLLLDVVDGVMVSVNVLIWIVLMGLLSDLASMLSILFGLNYYETEQNRTRHQNIVMSDAAFQFPRDHKRSRSR